MDYDLIVVKTLERVYKNYYYIIRGRLIVGNHSNPLPKNWEDRSEKYKKAYDVFGK